MFGYAQRGRVADRFRRIGHATDAHENGRTAAWNRVDQHLVRQPLDRTEAIAAGAAGGVAVAQTGGDVGHSGASVERQDLDAGGPLRVGAGEYFATAAVTQQVLRQFGHHDGDAAGPGFVVPHPDRQPDDLPAGGGDIGWLTHGQWLPWCYLQRAIVTVVPVPGVDTMVNSLHRRRAPPRPRPMPLPLV